MPAGTFWLCAIRIATGPAASNSSRKLWRAAKDLGEVGDKVLCGAMHGARLLRALDDGDGGIDGDGRLRLRGARAQRRQEESEQRSEAGN